MKTSNQLSLTRVFDVDEITLAAYLQADGQIDIFGRPLKLQGGFRYVTVDTQATFRDRFNNGAISTASPGSERLLPSFTARYEITSNFRARFNYGRRCVVPISATSIPITR